MVDTNDAYKAAITGDARRIRLRAVADISDPDKTWYPATTNGNAPWSRPDELWDKVFTQPPRYQTLERNRLILDGSTRGFPAGYNVPEHIGYGSGKLSGAAGAFSEPFPWVQLNFKMSILQAFSVFFSTDPLDGFPVDFVVEVRQGGTAYYSVEVTDNRETSLQFDGFTVYNPDCIRVTVKKWSLPSRYARMVEIIPGLYEDWDGDDLESLTVTQQGQFSCLTLPYGTADIGIDNSSRRFDPRRKNGIFQSITERQGVELYLGPETEQGPELLSVGTYYQSGAGWKTSDNSMVIKWSLMDIIGLVSGRTYILPKEPNPLPTTLEGWIGGVVAQLGDGFKQRFHVDPDYAQKPVTAQSREAVTGKSCGDIIRWACMAAGVWPRADAATGRLAAEPLWNQGNKLDLDNLTTYPTMKANESLAALIFQLSDGTTEVISGNATASEKTVTIINPFLHTREQALEAARLILAQYGGNVIETTGRGDPSSEIGDVDTVWLDESNATTARRMSQTFNVRDGALRDCRSTLLQADGSYLYTEFEVIRVSGVFKAPPGVHRLRIVLGQGGQGGGFGEDGYVSPFEDPITGHLGNQVYSGYGAPGQDGQGGLVWYGVIDCNEGQEFQVVLGAGGVPAIKPGVPGSLGGHTTFGPYSSENGKLYEYGYTDIANGQSFARTGVAAPLPGTGDGGKGGEGGEPGAGYLYKKDDKDIGYRYQQTKEPGHGHPGVAGATGFAMVTWEKPEERTM